MLSWKIQFKSMKIKITKRFRDKLNKQINYIARDKPTAARKFKNEIISRINGIPNMPYQNRKSIFFDDKEIRDMVFKGYVVVFRINKEKEVIEVFGFTKDEVKPI